MIEQSKIEEIKSRADIVEVVSDFIDLKKSGSSYKAKSPFKDERTPSFYVVPSKNFFKDFSTGKGGDAITFVMEMEGGGYVEAVRYLAKKYGIDLEERQLSDDELKDKNERESLFIIMKYATAFYQEQLKKTDEGKQVGLSYFKERGVSDEAIEKFELGFAPDAWDAILKDAGNKGYNEDLLVKAGLIQEKEGGKRYDRFRNRVIFPIHNLTGKVIAFGARILSNDKKQPKYLNSPETELYHKSNVLYGLHLAKQAIRAKSNCYLVEGYTDVIGLHQAGIENVVASSGTALTEEQIKLLSRYTDTLTVVFDGDSAGISASLRGMDIILEKGLNVKAVPLPDGEDPDSYVKTLGAGPFLSYLEDNAVDFIKFKSQVLLKDAGDDPIKRSQVVKEVVNSIALIPDAISRSILTSEAAKIFSLDEASLIAELNKILLKNNKQKRAKREAEEDISLESEGIGKANIEDHINAQPIEDQGELSELFLEGELLRLLISYGDYKIIDENDEEQLLSHYIFTHIDDINFSEPLINSTVSAYRELIEENQVPSIDFFLNHEDEYIRFKAIELTTRRYEISTGWKEHKIIVPDEADDLARITWNTLLKLKWRKLKKNINECKELIKSGAEEDLKFHQQMFMHFKDREKEIAEALGNVINR